MKLETNPVKIKQLSLSKEGENWGFRSFLKSCEIPEHKIDSTVQRFYKQVAKKIDCKKCSNCCKECKPPLTQYDVIKMAKGLNVTVKDFKKEYLVKAETVDAFTFDRKPCPFLIDNSCSVYDFRPECCSLYPDVFQDGFIKRLIGVIHNCPICPIVFNVFELLKEEIWNMDDSNLDGDDIDDW